MRPGVKRGRPGQPLTPGSFMRLRSKHVPIDKGRCKGRRFSIFTSIQLTHQQLNHRSVFIKTLCPLIAKQFSHSVQLSATHHLLFLSFFSFCNVKVCNTGVDKATLSWDNPADPGFSLRFHWLLADLSRDLHSCLIQFGLIVFNNRTERWNVL